MIKTKLAIVLSLLCAATSAHADNYPRAFRVGSGIQMVPRSTPPTAGVGNGILYVSSTDSFKLHFVLPNGTDAAVGSGGGGGGGSVISSAPLSGDGTSGTPLTCATCALTSGSYANPSWVTSLAGSKITGTVPNATAAVTAGSATSATTATSFTGSLGGVVSGTQSATTIGAGNITDTMIAGVSGSKVSGAVASATSATSATTATTATNFTGSLTGVVSGTQGSTTIANGNVTNAMLANSGIIVSTTSPLGGGGSLSLGGSLTLTCTTCVTTARTFTAGTGLTGGGDFSANRTFAIDSTVATLTGTQTLTGKSIDGASNTLTSIPESAVTNLTSDLSTLTTAVAGKAPTTRTLTAGAGLTGGGDLSVDRAFAIDSTVATLTGTQTLTNKTLTAPAIYDAHLVTSTGQSILSTAASGGTVAVVSSGSVWTAGKILSLQNDLSEVASVDYAGALTVPSVGPSGSQQHILPAVTSDTVALLGATQTLGNKTLTAPIINTVAGSPTAAGELRRVSGTTPSLQVSLDGSTWSTLATSDSGSMGFSLVDFCGVNGGTLASAGGGETVGMSVMFTKPVTVTGIRFYWAGGAGATTVKVSIWDHTGTQVATLSGVAVNAAGVYSGTFGAPLTVSASATYQTYTVGMYNSANYTYQSAAASLPGGYNAAGLIVSPWLTWLNNTLYFSGDGQPATAAGSGIYMPVEPVFTIP